MNKILSLVFMLCPVAGLCQLTYDSSFTYLNKFKTPCEEAFAGYYRKSAPYKGSWIARDYFLSGRLSAEAVYSDKELKIKNGPYRSYYENGMPEEQSFYVEDKRDSACLTWYKDGNKCDEENYRFGIPHGKNMYYHPNGKLCALEIYDRGSLTRAKCWNEQGEPQLDCPIEVMPEFPGGTEAMMEFLSANIEYPRGARRNNVETRLEMVFTVETDGSISNIGANGDDPYPDFFREAVKVIEKMPRWKPAIIHNRPASVKFTLPISFKLTD